ncbi:hypothetical protein ACFU8I_40875 [Streptomyces sp. NPDC057540]|uniref:hypothetical protein n=1 Tax=Streptomyces sp. NPDC057540 TaxID=3346160 RepID=UPI0036B2A092
MTAALAAAGVLAPPTDPSPDTCTALFADPDGDWWQCQEDHGHDGRHDDGDWSWTDDEPDTIPARPTAGSH